MSSQMKEVMAIHHTLLYIVFTKGARNLGKGISYIIFDEEPLVRHLMRTFGVHRLTEIRRQIFSFLEENVDKLKYPHSREALLTDFEMNYENQIIAETLNIIEYKFKAQRLDEATRALELYIRSHEALDFLEKIKHGYSVTRTAGLYSVLVKPTSEYDLELLETLSWIGLTIHLPKGHSYLAEYLGGQDYFIIPFTSLQGTTIQRIKDIIENAIEKSHKAIQKAIEELGRILGYEARTERTLEDRPYKLDVAWLKDDRIVKAFEVQFAFHEKGRILSALHNLKSARRRGAEVYLIIPPQRHAVNEVMSLLIDEPELKDAINILTVNQVLKLYEVLKGNKVVLSLLR